MRGVGKQQMSSKGHRHMSLLWFSINSLEPGQKYFWGSPVPVYGSWNVLSINKPKWGVILVEKHECDSPYSTYCIICDGFFLNHKYRYLSNRFIIHSFKKSVDFYYLVIMVAKTIEHAVCAHLILNPAWPWTHFVPIINLSMISILNILVLQEKLRK